MKTWQKSSLQLFLATISAGIVASSAYCYEIETHASMSGEAAKQSVINTVLSNLGFNSLDDFVQAEGRKFPLIDWIREGARREDDTFSESFARYRNHFFDPRPNAPNNGGFTGIIPVIGFLSGLPAPDWALEPTLISEQIYGFKDARAYFFNALTKPTKADRDANLALTFRTIGQVVHVVQDMAQPQHTRDDVHAFPPSLFERYTDRDSVRTKLDFLGGTIPQFTKPRDFFVNDQGTGLAQYTNRSFVSQGTNFGWSNSTAQPNATYDFPKPLPDPEVASVQNLDVPQAIKDYCGASAVCNMRFYSSMNDRGEIQQRAATRSIFADDLDQYNINSPSIDGGARFSLNVLNFKAVLPNLIPRAVGYSAGLINYFFRGKIDLVDDSANLGKLVLQNLGTENMDGTFELYYDGLDDTRYPVPGASWTIPIDAGKASQVAFSPPYNSGNNPEPNHRDEYLLVFKGTMGAEGTNTGSLGAVVAKKVIINSFLTITDARYYPLSNYPKGYVIFYFRMDSGTETVLRQAMSQSTVTINGHALTVVNGLAYAADANFAAQLDLNGDIYGNKYMYIENVDPAGTFTFAINGATVFSFNWAGAQMIPVQSAFDIPGAQFLSLAKLYRVRW